MASAMGGFLSRMLEEMGARRRRLRQQFGERGQGLVEFATFGGLALGSLGLLLAPWMPAAAPWGFALPVVFLLGFVLIERRRQRQAAFGGIEVSEAAKEDEEVELRNTLRKKQIDDPTFTDVDSAQFETQFRAERRQSRLAVRTDWTVLLWSLACAVAGVAAFVIAWTARPAGPEDNWQPPASAIDSEIGAPPQ